MLKNKFFLSAVLAMAVPMTAQSAVLIDGGHNWDISSDNWTPNAGSNIAYVIDDWDPDVSGANPAYNNTPYTNGRPGGGQAYDAEAMYIELEGTTLYVAIKTGLSPNNSSWKAGDIFFDLNGDVASTSYRSVSNDGSTGSYAADDHGVIEATSGNGYEYGLVSVAHDANAPFTDGNSWAAGDLYDLNRWNLAGVSAHEDNDHPVSGNQGSLSNSNTLMYGNESGGTGHYVIEASISLVDGSGNYNAFGNSLIASIDNAADINVHWNPLCNNDWIQFTGNLTGGGGGYNQVSEPMPLALMALGFIGMAARKRNQKV